MFKDPHDNTATPYEVLGIDSDTPIREVHAALPRLMRESRDQARIRLAMDAVKKLKDTHTRAAVDIWLYDVDVVDHAGLEIDLEWLDEFARVEVVPPFQLCTDLDALDPGVVTDVVPSCMKFTELTYYDGLAGLAIHPRLDR
jgi:hypothetical protein